MQGVHVPPILVFSLNQIINQLISSIFATTAKEKGIYNKYTCIIQRIDNKYSRRVCAP